MLLFQSWDMLRHVETLHRPAEGLYWLADFGWLWIQHMSDAWSEECPTFLCLAGHITPSTASEEGGWFSAAGASCGASCCTMLIDVVASVRRGLRISTRCSRCSFNVGWCSWGSSFKRSRAAQTVLISAIERVTGPLLCFLLSQILLFASARISHTKNL